MLRTELDAMIESAGSFITSQQRRGLVVTYERAVAYTANPSERTATKFQRAKHNMPHVPFLTHEAIWGGFREGQRRKAQATQAR